VGKRFFFFPLPLGTATQHAARGRAGQGTAASKGLVAGGIAGKGLGRVAANAQRCNHPRAMGREGFAHQPWAR